MDTYHGVSVTDLYRWLENWDDPEVRAWTDKQNVYTRSQLDALPFMPALRARVQALGADTHPTWRNVLYRHGRLFAIERQPPREQPMLVVFESLDGPSGRRVIVDPSAIDTAGTTSIDL
jgi:prolyl oligopeptidase